MTDRTVKVMFGMETHEITAHTDGRVTVKLYTETGMRDGGSYESVTDFLDAMTPLGYGKTCRRALENAGVVM